MRAGGFDYDTELFAEPLRKLALLATGRWDEERVRTFRT